MAGRESVVDCDSCPRLIRYCRGVAKEKRKAFETWEYWGRPVPDFGDARAGLLIVGLAPAAHGANRTGRMFTGDRSGEWLYRALHRAGFANQPDSVSSKDRMKLKGALITAVCHCAPPDNKPAPGEIENCRSWLEGAFDQTPFQAVLALGAIAWKASLLELKRLKILPKGDLKFMHGKRVQLEDGRLLMASYHPSQQNTFTGRLTEPMFDEIFAHARNFLEV